MALATGIMFCRILWYRELANRYDYVAETWDGYSKRIEVHPNDVC